MLTIKIQYLIAKAAYEIQIDIPEYITVKTRMMIGNYRKVKPRKWPELIEENHITKRAIL